MVKNIRLTIDDSVFEKLSDFRKKKGFTWEEMLLNNIKGVEGDKEHETI